MSPCKHTTLILLPDEKGMLRCRTCHLLISAEELGDGCCPECLEASGKRQYDFDEVAPQKKAEATYRCETCGVIIKSRDNKR